MNPFIDYTKPSRVTFHNNYSTFMSYPNNLVRDDDECRHCHATGGKKKEWVLLINALDEAKGAFSFSWAPDRFPFHKKCAQIWAKSNDREFTSIVPYKTVKVRKIKPSDCAQVVLVAVVMLAVSSLMAVGMAEAGMRF